MLIVNLVFLGLGFWLIIHINHNYLQTSIRNENRFRLYELRDELSLLAMSKKVNENSDEYKTLIAITNSAIRVTGTFRVTDFISFVLRFHDDVQTKGRLEHVRTSLAVQDNGDFCRIASEVFSIMTQMLRRDTRTLKLIVYPLAKFLKLLHVAKPYREIESRKLKIDTVDRDWSRYRNQFAECQIAA